MIRITIEDDETIVGIKDKHCWTLEDTVSVFQIVLNKFFGSDVEVSVQSKQKSTVEVPTQEAEGM
tara:strand:+ start:937 stop:1131 length:195 start_codon:yes stop_codon:yes gene_type:complete